MRSAKIGSEIDRSSLYKKWNQIFMGEYHLTTPRNS
jgi:hypothetical protein